MPKRATETTTNDVRHSDPKAIAPEWGRTVRALAMQDPGSTRVIQRIISNLEDEVVCEIAIPDEVEKASPWKSSELLHAFEDRHEVIPLGVAGSSAPSAGIHVDPPGELLGESGMSLFCISKIRLRDIDWRTFTAAG